MFQKPKKSKKSKKTKKSKKYPSPTSSRTLLLLPSPLHVQHAPSSTANIESSPVWDIYGIINEVCILLQ